MLTRRRCCCSGTCAVSITSLKGCNNLPYPGATLNVWDNSGKTVLIGTANTDASGFVSVDIPSAGTYYIELVSNSVRFNGGASTVSVTCNQILSASPFVLTLGTGYVSCIPGCLYPVASPIHNNMSNTFCNTMSWITTPSPQWSNVCLGMTPILGVTIRGSNATCTATLVSCPPSLLINVTACTDGTPDFSITE